MLKNVLVLLLFLLSVSQGLTQPTDSLAKKEERSVRTIDSIPLFSFIEVKVDYPEIVIEWGIKQRINTAYIDIERFDMFEGKFITVGSVIGRVANDSLQKYRYSTAIEEQGNQLFRIVHVNFKGESKMSEVVGIFVLIEKRGNSTVIITTE